ncbi:hypothetical protein BASA60_004367 [Batrachochytrium salamandrivorans]|nr:hypothetical protein BASA60_004367 [Batrachochytrium salamandrivorans]
MAVAQKLYEHFPEASLLRRHPAPNSSSLAKFVQKMEHIGIKVDSSTSGTLQASFEAIEDPLHQMLIRMVAIRTMQCAVYFSSGNQCLSNYSHYALCVPFYTHFTSPIRRYCDLVVHRLLDHALTAEEKAGEIIAEAFVQDVGSRSYDVMVPQYGIDQRVWIEDAIDAGDALGVVSNEEKVCLTVYWRRKEEDMTSVDSSDELSLRMNGLQVSQETSLAEPMSLAEDNQSTNADNDVPFDPKKTKVQVIKMFARVFVRIVVSMNRGPSLKLLAMYPYPNMRATEILNSAANDLSAVCFQQELDD